MPNSYRSTGVVYVDTANILGPLLEGLAIEPDTQAELGLMQNTLISRPNLEKVVRQTDLDLTVKSSAEMERLIARLEARITIGRQGDNLFSISYTDKDPQLARDIVQSLLNIFVENNLGRNREDLEMARRFIEEQIRSYEKQLEEAEARLAKFKQRNMTITTNQSGYLKELDQAKAQLALEENQLRDAKLRRETIQQELKAIPRFLPTDTAGASLGPSSNTDIQILELQKVLEDLLSRYTDKHPDVVIAKRKLASLLEQQAKELDAAAQRAENLANDTTDTGPNSGLSNPVYEQLKVQLVQEEANIAPLYDRVNAAKAALERIQSLATRVPEVEAELTRLNRDYDVIKGKYNELLSRREAERLSRARETQADNVQFRIIESPNVPAVPLGPNRYLFLAMVLAAGVASGVGFSLVLAYSGDAFTSAAQLRQAFNVPVLGGIATSDFVSRSWNSYCGAAVFWGGLMALLATFAGLVMVEWRLGLDQVAAATALSKLAGGWIDRLPIF